MITQGENKEGKGVPAPLGEIEIEACRLRFEGFNADESHKQLKIRFGEQAPAVRTIQNWFWKGGKLGVWYEGYAAEQASIRRKETSDVFRAYLKEAARTLVTLMRTSTVDLVRLNAAKEIINRELGEPLKVVSDTGKDPAQRILEEMGILKKKDDGGTDQKDD